MLTYIFKVPTDLALKTLMEKPIVE